MDTHKMTLFSNKQTKNPSEFERSRWNKSQCHEVPNVSYHHFFYFSLKKFYVQVKRNFPIVSNQVWHISWKFYSKIFHVGWFIKENHFHGLEPHQMTAITKWTCPRTLDFAFKTLQCFLLEKFLPFPYHLDS